MSVLGALGAAQILAVQREFERKSMKSHSRPLTREEENRINKRRAKRDAAKAARKAQRRK